MSKGTGRARYSDWDDDPRAKAWIRDVRRNLIPKLTDSAMVMSLVPSDGKADVKFAVELGFSIMMDKPIILAVSPGTKVPERLARVADDIVEVDLTDDVSRERMAASLNAAMKRLKEGDGRSEEGGGEEGGGAAGG